MPSNIPKEISLGRWQDLNELSPFYRTWDSGTGGAGLGDIQLNNVDYSLATEMNISPTNDDSQDQVKILETFGSGDIIKLVSFDNFKKDVLFTIDGPIVAGVLPVTFIYEGSEVPFESNESILIEIFKSAALAIGSSLNTEYIHDVATGDADPGAGKSRINNADYSLATFIFVDDVDDNAFPTSVLLERLEFGDFVYQKQLNDEDRSVVFKVIGQPIDGSGYWKIPVEHVVSGSGGNLEDTERIGIVFFRTGDSAKTKVITGTTHTLDDNDDEFRLLFTNAADILVTVNTGLTNPFFACTFEQGNTGEISWTGSATINNPDLFADPKTEKQHVEVSLKGKGSDIYTLNGRVKP